ncbi:oleate hydratase [Rhodoferax sp.]|uniref:oleate hydratase n=1 Tax=Rhodoferax sp. TaxID=50421 RepID=UPI00283F927D|nr:oleate hydratase [Rhodoferax sp.]MDR3367592.1 oleate hydratase [Rhodoferax sp.]
MFTIDNDECTWELFKSIPSLTQLGQIVFEETVFAFQPWHRAVEFWRYLHRFLLEILRIETLAGVKSTIYNQCDSLVVPLQSWLHFSARCSASAVTRRVPVAW